MLECSSKLLSVMNRGWYNYIGWSMSTQFHLTKAAICRIVSVKSIKNPSVVCVTVDLLARSRQEPCLIHWPLVCR